MCVEMCTDDCMKRTLSFLVLCWRCHYVCKIGTRDRLYYDPRMLQRLVFVRSRHCCKSFLSMMAASSFPGVLSCLRNKCSNCALFDWEQPDAATLKQCAKCKVVQYCGEHCQKEHWMQVHKHHCKMLAFMKDTGFTAFLAVKAPDDTLEILAILMQKIIFKMLSSGMWSHPGFRGPLTQLGEAMSEGIEQTWAMRRVFPREFSILCLDKGGLYEETQKIRVGDLWSDWSTLHLVWGRLIEYRRVAQLNSLKEPREALPKELWTGLREEMGVFPVRVAELIKAFSGDKFPSFKELLKIICGGTLLQRCSFCHSSVSVVAVEGEVEGFYKTTATVALLPHMAPMFRCGESNCAAEMEDKVFEHQKWELAIDCDC